MAGTRFRLHEGRTWAPLQPLVTTAGRLEVTDPETRREVQRHRASLVAGAGVPGDFLPRISPGAAESGNPIAMSLAVPLSLVLTPDHRLEESIMTATYTFNIFSSLDGFGSVTAATGVVWASKARLLDHRLAAYSEEQMMVLGANTYGLFVRFLASQATNPEVGDPSVTRMLSMPTTVVSNTLEGPLDWPNATAVSGDAVEVVARLKEQSELPLRSHGSLSMNRALMAAALVDRVQVTLFPVITGQSGQEQSSEVRPTLTSS